MISLRPVPSGILAVLSAALMALLLVGWGLHHRSSTLAPRPSAISTNLSAGWVPFGGAWRSEGPEIIGDSEDRGPKLMNGSLDWENYFVEADVRLLGIYGDAGIIIRSSGEEEGVDSYHGYFAGIRNMDNSFLLGRADFGWNLFVLKSISPKVDGWYHIKLLAYDCSIAAAITNASGLNERSYVTDPHCLAKGRFGLKSYETSAEWKNVHIGPAGMAELQSFTEGLQPTVVSYNSDAPESGFSTGALDQYIDPLRREAEEHKFHLTTQPIGSLGLGHSEDSGRVTIRGIVTIVRPVLYVQDSTGAILLQPDGPVGPVRVGDEVEAQGVLPHDSITPELNHASIQLLWPDTPILPIVVTPFELAAGRNTGRFVETDGVLLSQSVTANRSLLLTMENDSQVFYVIAGDDSDTSSKGNFRVGSRLRLRGVATSDAAFTNNLVPFAILVSSLANVQLIGPPPWWTPIHIVSVLALLLLLLGVVHLTLSHMQRWRHEVVLREREHVALEIHDTLAQSFAGIGFQLQAMRADAAENEPIRKQLDVALNMVRRSHNEAKRGVTAIESAIDSGPSIAESLKKVAEQLSAGRPLAISSSSEGQARKIPKLVAETIFRVGQEAIYNCIRHSGASRIDIKLDVQRSAAQLIVQDNGAGFAVGAGNFGFGLRGMSRRAASVSGHLEISSSQNAGTSVLLRAPIGLFFTLPQRSMRWFNQFSKPKVDPNGKPINFVGDSHPDC
jgi:signal transduction histidine kinase